MTHSLIAKTFSKVCFEVLSRTLLAGEKITMGGFALNILKKENGLKLIFPASSIVLTKAIGLGAIAFCRIICVCVVLKSANK
jgi:hypothetical protein